MEGKYAELMFTLPQEVNEVTCPDGDSSFIYSPQVYFRGATQIPGSQVNFGFQIISKPFFLDRVPHTHKVDEYVIFAGAVFPNLFDFDAEAEFTFGEEGVDAETYHITRPTVIRVPAGTKHCPLKFTRIGKPVLFSAILTQDMFNSVYETKSGPEEFWYNGPGACRLDPTKKCDACRKCIDK